MCVRRLHRVLRPGWMVRLPAPQRLALLGAFAYGESGPSPELRRSPAASGMATDQARGQGLSCRRNSSR